VTDANLIEGRYRLGVELGAGAFGSVYKATQVVLGHDMRDLALKLFHGSAVNESNVRQMMTDALAILALMDRLPDWEIRQHFVTVYDLGVTNENPRRGFVAMELVRGGSLEGRLKDFGKFSLAGTFHYMLQLTRALAFMHDEGFVHSDLKPANVFVFRGRGRELLKVGDFGLAGRFVSPLGGDGPAGGTMSYLPSEALMGLPTTPAGDVFSLGVIAYELLTGSNPYSRVGHTLDRESPTFQQDSDRMQLQSRHPALTLRKEMFPELADPNGELAYLTPFVDVLNRMLAESLADRYASARPAYDDLERIAAKEKPILRTGPIAGTVSKDSTADSLARFEGHLSRKEWEEARALAKELAKQTPARASGHLLLARVEVAVAKNLESKGSPPTVVQKYLRQAIVPLQRGLAACDASAEKRQLGDELSNLYTRLGDHDLADVQRRQKY